MKNNRFQQKASCSTFASCQHEKELINISTMNYQGGVCNLCPYLSLKATAAPSPGVWTSVSVITNHVLADQTLRRRFVMVCELCVSVSITQAELPAAHLLLLLLLKLPHLAPLLLISVVFLTKPSAHNSVSAPSLPLSLARPCAHSLYPRRVLLIGRCD